MPNTSQRRGAAGIFATTHWTVILKAGRNSSPEAQAALESLCRTYWYPLYAFVRREGHGPHDAQDLTQAFFERFLEKDYLRAVRKERGKFRSFLLSSLKHFLANEWDRSHAQKRGGGVTFLSIDDKLAEDRYRLEPADCLSAERIYERGWAYTLLDTVLDCLQREFAAEGKSAEFERMKVFLSGDKTALPYAQLAAQWGMTEANLKVSVHRLRKRYRELLRAEISQTVTEPGEIEAEIRHLVAVLSA